MSAPLLVKQTHFMKTKARVDLSKRWRFILLAAYLGLMAGFAVKQLTAQDHEQNNWRRTSRGWEYAHAIQPSSSPHFTPSPTREPTSISTLHQWHRLALPVSLCSFIITFGCWVLTGVRNRGVVRRLGTQ